jgi:predicted DNA-binding transcriptional regulator AlpA
MAVSNENERLTQAQVAQELGVSEAWCERRRWSGTGPAFVKVGRRVRYLRADLDAWVAAQRRTSTRVPSY